MTMNELERLHPLTLEEYLALDEEVRRESEVVEGNLIPREPRDRPHQKTAFRLAGAFEAAVLKYRAGHSASTSTCYEVNTEVPLRLWEVPLTVRKPDAIVHRCREQFEMLEAGDAVIVAEVISRWSESRDRIHKMGEYAKALIPHYLIVQFDELGATIVEHYALMGTDTSYSRIGTTHRDRDLWALNVTIPFEIQIGWPDLAIGLPA
ncbi:Uma2 family endonuclease [Actinomadura formosensis]|uniref:Uma2 family endonuclease n=1 Tax=Actinomadura formosensis TaxID=60706 RepID=UPI003D942B1F